MYDKDKANLQSFDNIKEIMFLNSDSEFELAENLTLSSVYNPFCDFEKFGLRYNYLSDLYKKECENDIRSMLNWVFKIHCKFSKGDIENLANREFAIYFWSKYLIKKDVNIAIIRDYINEGLFDEVACVPH